jgi:hypothetical protein
MKTANVSLIKNQKQWNDITYYSVLLDNGDKINIGRKKPLSVGDSLSYEYDQKDDGQQEYRKAKAVNPEFNKGSQQTHSNGSTSDKDLHIAKQTCLKAAAEFHAQSSVDATTVVATAQIFLNWINGAKVEKKESDDLPF